MTRRRARSAGTSSSASSDARTLAPASVAREIGAKLRELPAQNTPAVRSVRRRWSRQLAAATPSVVLEVARTLLERGAWPERLIAYELLAGHVAFASLDDAAVEALGAGLDDWGSIDLFGVTVAGPAWRWGLVSDATVRAWAASSDRWRRRLALVATVALNSRARGGAGDARRTLAVCRALRHDRDPMVVKALSWALRELGKREPDRVQRFLAEHEPWLAPRVLREVRHKLATGVKARRRERERS
jgi:hypothetical protein